MKLEPLALGRHAVDAAVDAAAEHWIYIPPSRAKAAERAIAELKKNNDQ